MKKTTTCAFCGKELKTSILGQGSEVKHISFGFTDLNCCPHCHQKYAAFARQDGGRFSNKLENAFYDEDMLYDLAGLLSQEEIAQYFITYYEESKAYDLNRVFSHFFPTEDDADGLVSCVLSAEESFFLDAHTPTRTAVYCNELISSENAFAIDCGMRGTSYVPNAPWPFGPEDVSCLEYTYSDEEAAEDTMAVKIFVRFNDSRRITYKPCVVQGVVLYPNHLHSSGDYIDRQVARFMLQLRRLLGVEHLPIVKMEEDDFCNAGQMPAVKNPYKPKLWEHPIVRKITSFFEGVAEKIHTLRIVCSFVPVLATIGFLLMLLCPSSVGVNTWIGLFSVLSSIAVLIACPLHFLGILAKLVAGGFMIGLGFAGIGCVIGGGIGLILAAALFMYAPAFITIPYCFKNLI